ncbi:hypothetical protein LX64_00813 [Chitinophaga skermanii]|uniref:Uncharacterized protein n=1 Tax=Chitinophaga skermanii TaxID=331697 RepID=A0A327R683_9BACT|nr:hypothetical protein [Chitinophaga skermanii]RAJ11204.1 hypothetical protein LX64_00813 [Chitinophaga skermanii]
MKSYASIVGGIECSSEEAKLFFKYLKETEFLIDRYEISKKDAKYYFDCYFISPEYITQMVMLGSNYYIGNELFFIHQLLFIIEKINDEVNDFPFELTGKFNIRSEDGEFVWNIEDGQMYVYQWDRIDKEIKLKLLKEIRLSDLQ